MIALMAHDKNDLHLILDRVPTAAILFGLIISFRKTESLYQKAPDMDETLRFLHSILVAQLT